MGVTYRLELEDEDVDGAADIIGLLGGVTAGVLAVVSGAVPLLVMPGAGAPLVDVVIPGAGELAELAGGFGGVGDPAGGSTGLCEEVLPTLVAIEFSTVLGKSELPCELTCARAYRILYAKTMLGRRV